MTQRFPLYLRSKPNHELDQNYILNSKSTKSLRKIWISNKRAELSAMNIQFERPGVKHCSSMIN